MKIIAINGSPRHDGNSAKMLHRWVDGFKSVHPEAEVKWVNIYSLKFTGCRSCFACKRIDGKFYGHCPIRDDIYDLIEEVYAADAVGIASPIYFGDISAYLKCFLERAMFSRTTYRVNHDSNAAKPVPVTMIYTMNVPPDVAEEFHYPKVWDTEEWYVANAFRHPVKRLCAYFTYQFDNYANYEAEMFDEGQKRHYRDTQFPQELQAAFDSGAETAGAC